ncbi:MAG TPA: ribbon-helix-helix domain-containing protein [Thermoplasmata archaeon]|nr:ribbon-helix-helix domain-containing protein [Thermoplasmata archaeon]
METISLKLTKEQARRLAQATKEEGFPSKSEFIRYALARALEERLSVETLEEIFEGRRQIREGKTVSLEQLTRES